MTGRAAAVAAALVAVLALAGCGVPDSGPAVVVGDAAHNGTTNEPSAGTRPVPDGVTDAQDLVSRYLEAAAGGNEVTQDQPDAVHEALNKAATWAKAFFTDDAAASWQPGQEIIVVRATLKPAVPTANGIRVDADLQPVGALDSRGIIEPRPGLAARSWPFTVVPAAPGVGLRIANPPPNMLLLSTEGLTALYDVQPIYFWDSSEATLVPDLRYVSRFLVGQNRLAQLTNWLIDGPSDYLRAAVERVPAAIELKDLPVPEANGGFRVNLVAKAASAQPELARFVAQLRWSVRPLTGPVELQIEGQDVPGLQDLTGDYGGVPPPDQRDPPRFCVVGGQVRQLGGDQVAMPALDSDVNAGVVSAGILGGNRPEVALVRTDGPGRQRLWLGRYDQTNQIAHYLRTDVTAAAMGQPVGVLTDDGPVFLVPADGHLLSVSASGVEADDTPPGLGPVTQVSAAPDGRRLALIAGGRPYVAVLQLDGGLAVSQPTAVNAGVSDASGIAWSREEWVVVAGRVAGQTALVEVTLDSVLSDAMQLRNLAGLAVTRVVADAEVRFGDPPAGSRGLILLEADNRVYRVYSESVEVSSDVPTPLATPSSSGSKAPVPTAPFFEG